MKKILVHINTFIMFVLTIIFILFIEFQIELRPNNIITNLEKLNYYQKAYSNILQNLDDIIVNNKLKEELIEYYSIDILKKDVNLIVRGNKINHYDEIKTIVSKYSKDQKTIEKYRFLIQKEEYLYYIISKPPFHQFPVSHDASVQKPPLSYQ